MTKIPFLHFCFLITLATIPKVHAQDVQPISYDYSALYERLNPSIVKIEVDFGHGSGFLVGHDGLIATNHHVVANTRHLAVEMSDGRRVQAEIIRLVPQFDLALIKVNSSLVTDLTPLPLLPESSDSTVKPGVPVVAFGSPLAQTFLITTGIVSKVEERVLLGDFLLEPGNSGGPLMNLNGEVIGINTFGTGDIAGAVRVKILRDQLAHEDLVPLRSVEPAAASLTKVSDKTYPIDILKRKLLEEELEDDDYYRFDGNKFVVTVLTPVTIAKFQVQEDLMQAANRYKRRGKKIADPSYSAIDEPFYDWYRNASNLLDYAVQIEIKPDFGTTTGSKWMSVLTAALSGSSGVYQSPYKTYEFKAEFWDFRLYRDGELIEPIRSGRQITEQNLVQTSATFVDEAYSGWYVYDPSVFMTGEEFTMDIYDAREPEKIHKSKRFESDSKIITKIRADFAETESMEP